MHPSWDKDRIASAAGVILLHALLGYAFLSGLGFDFAPTAERGLKVFDIPQSMLPPPATPAQDKGPEPADRIKPAPKDPEGGAAPANIRSRPTEVVAPEPMILLPIPSPVPAAPIAGPDAAATSGHAPVRGPGTGAGGEGVGTGSGASGDGGGGGGDAGRGTRPVRLRGEIRNSDYPCPHEGECGGGIVHIRFTVLTTGRVGRCVVTGSSGNPEMDATTCRLLERRLRYRPARDASGRRIEAVIEGEQVWEPRIAPDREIEGDGPGEEQPSGSRP